MFYAGLFDRAEENNMGNLHQPLMAFLTYTIMINNQLSIYTSMIHSLLFLKPLDLTLNSLDTLSDIRIKAVTLLF
jgi:hypothetical protein